MSSAPLSRTLPIGNVVEAMPLETFHDRLNKAATAADYIRPWGNQRRPRIRDLARELDMTPASVTRLFSGEQGARPTFDVVVALSKVFKVSPIWLATGKGPMQELSAGELVSSIRNLPPKLDETLKRQPSKWTSTTLAAALHPDTLAAKTRSDSDGTPEGGWAALLDDLQGNIDRSTAVEQVTESVRTESGPARRLPRRRA